MARIRTIKPEMFQDEKLAKCDVVTRFVFIGLIGMADDAGRMLDNVRVIDAFIFPETGDSSHEALMRLSGMGRIQRGKTASGQRVIQIVNWNTHQRIQHANLRSALPEIVEVQEVTPSHEALMNHSGGAHEPLTHHTNDQRPTTYDQRPTTGGDVNTSRPEKKREAHAHFADDDRKAAREIWTRIRGPITMDKLVKALGPVWPKPGQDDRPAGADLLKALTTYCTLVSKGKSAPFAKIEKAADLLIPLCKTHSETDRIARYNAAFLLIHGHMPQRVAA